MSWTSDTHLAMNSFHETSSPVNSSKVASNTLYTGEILFEREKKYGISIIESIEELK